MDELCGLAARHSLFMLEDCAQAHGATYQGKKVGTFGQAASYSFFPSKNLGAWGDAGGMTTNDEALGRRARMITQHGQSGKKHDHQIEGRNSRMDGIQAAVLSVKLRHLDDWTQRRRATAARYHADLHSIVTGLQTRPSDSASVYHLFTVGVPSRDAIQADLAAQGIATAVQYPIPLPLLRAYAAYGHRAEDFPVATALTSHVLSLPIYPEITLEQETAVLSAVRRAVERVTACP